MDDQVITPAIEWHAADSGYQAHHNRCAHCIAAGATQGERGRCTVGQALWSTYVDAGLPTFFNPAITKGTSACASTSPAQ